jgi:hypothetical protein
LKNFIIIFVIAYFGIVDLKYGLLLLILLTIDLNNRLENENENFILNHITRGINNLGRAMTKLGKKTVSEEEESRESFIGLKSITDSITDNETFKSLKKKVKMGARNVLKSIQEEESVATPEGEEEEEEEDEDEDEIENFETRKKKKKSIERFKRKFFT